MTPAMVHHGQAAHILAHRQVVLDSAFRAHPERLVRKPPRPPELPSQVWINRPPSEENTPYTFTPCVSFLLTRTGPGDVTNPWTFAIFAPWEKQFTVVQWDQRGAGRTLRKSGPSVSPTVTVARMVRDGIELSEYLRKHLGKDKIIAVCHSFGSILGVGMVRARPELFYAYVGTGQVADETRNYSAAYDAMLKKARATNNPEAIADMTRVGHRPTSPARGLEYSGNGRMVSRERTSFCLGRWASRSLLRAALWRTSMTPQTVKG